MKKGNTADRVKFILECVHVLFTLPLILTVIVLFTGERAPSVLLAVYFSGWLVLPALILQKKVLRKDIRLGKCIPIMAAVAVVEGAIGAAAGSVPFLLRYRAGITVFLVLASVLIGIDTLLVRKTETDRQEALRLGDVDFTGQNYMLQKPVVPALAFMAVFYIVGLIAETDTLCNIVLVTSVLYLIAAKAYDFIERSENYIRINHSTAALPAKRIMSMGTLLFLTVIAALLLAAVPAFATGRFRIHPELHIEVPTGTAADTLGISAIDPSALPPQGAQMGNPLEQLVPEDDFEWPAWVNSLVYVFAAVIAVFVLIAALKAVREVFRKFTRVYDENGDVIETIDPEEERASYYAGGRPDRRTAAGGIRYRYRRLIRKSLKGRPMPQETPLEMEQRAGIAERPDVIRLHEEYEAVRYGEM